MERIASFTVNHDVLTPGLYLSRRDGSVTTFDLRFKKPNTGDLLTNAQMHSVEHIIATALRNSEQKEAVIRILLDYDNVKIYDFQAELDWVTDLDNYIDAWHYGPWINDAIIERMVAGINRITDWTQARENDALLLRYTEYIEACSDWPEDFSALDAGK